jgi:hypothetical protein
MFQRRSTTTYIDYEDDSVDATANSFKELTVAERMQIRHELAEARAARLMPRIHLSIFSRPLILAKAVTPSIEAKADQIKYANDPLAQLTEAERVQIQRELTEARASGLMPKIHMSIFSRPRILAKMSKPKSKAI